MTEIHLIRVMILLYDLFDYDPWGSGGSHAFLRRQGIEIQESACHALRRKDG